MDRHLHAGERLAVHAQDIADAAQLHPRGEGIQHLLAAAGFHAEVGLAALAAAIQQGAALAVPLQHFLRADARQHRRAALEELHRRHRRAAGQLLRQREKRPVHLRVNLVQGAGGLGEEGERLPSLPAGQLPRQCQEADPLRLMHVSKQDRTLL